jgi:hypothetical protein
MNHFYEPFQYALALGRQITLTIFGCALALGLAHDFGLHRPWPLPVILGGILSLMIMEAFPYAWTLGKYTGVAMRVLMACAAYCMPFFAQKNAETRRKTVWDYFNEVDPTDPQQNATDSADR